MSDKYPTTCADMSAGREPLPVGATDDERRLAAIGVQFENGDVPREGVAFLLNLSRDLMVRLREANEALVEAGFATMTAIHTVKVEDCPMCGGPARDGGGMCHDCLSLNDEQEDADGA